MGEQSLDTPNLHSPNAVFQDSSNRSVDTYVEGTWCIDAEVVVPRSLYARMAANADTRKRGGHHTSVFLDGEDKLVDYPFLLQLQAERAEMESAEASSDEDFDGMYSDEEYGSEWSEEEEEEEEEFEEEEGYDSSADEAEIGIKGVVSLQEGQRLTFPQKIYQPDVSDERSLTEEKNYSSAWSRGVCLRKNWFSAATSLVARMSSLVRFQ